MRLKQRWLILILILCTLLTHAEAHPQPSARDLVGSTWAINDSDKQTCVFNFLASGKLNYIFSTGAKGKGAWKQTGDSVLIELNGKFVVYTGTLSGDQMTGHVRNKNGRQWLWTAAREGATVATPETPNYPPLAVAAGVMGNIIVEVSINTTGAVTTTKIIQGHPLLDQTAETAAMKWRFTPDANGLTARTARLFFTFRIMPTGCRDAQKVIPPARLSPYQLVINRGQPCVEY